MGTLVEDAKEAAGWMAQALRSSGYEADFSASSLAEIDRFFDDHSSPGKPRRGGLLAKDLGSRLFAIGAYVGEVVVRELDGRWQAPADRDDEDNLAVVYGDGAAVWPIQRVMKRYANGREDGIAAYGVMLGLDAGPVFPTGRRRRFWRG